VKKPYFVTLTTVAVVMARDAADAAQVARDVRRDIFSETPPEHISFEVGNSLTLQAQHAWPAGWSLDLIPYGGDGNTPLCDILRA